MTTAWELVQARAKRPPTVLDAWRAEHGPERVRALTTSAGSVVGSEFYDAVARARTGSGVVVDERSAMRVSAVYACVGIIAGAITMIPIGTYRRTRDGEKRAQKSDVWWLLNEEPLRRMTAATFWRYMLQARLFHGDAFAEILRGNMGEAVGFRPIHPGNVEPKAVGDQLFYAVRDTETGRVYGLQQDDMLHITGDGFDGKRSLSPLQYALQDSAGTAIAAGEYSGAFFRNGARPDFALRTDKQTMSREQIDLLRDQIDSRHRGTENAHRPIVLTGGLSVEKITMSSVDAQLLEARKFQVEDVARVFRVPPFMIGHTEKTTSWGSGVEHMSIGFVQYTLGPHLEAIEQELNRKLFKTQANFCEFNVEGLLRGDSKTRSDFYKGALGGPGSGDGWMTINEVRAKENLPPIAGGDELYRAPRDQGTTQ